MLRTATLGAVPGRKDKKRSEMSTFSGTPIFNHADQQNEKTQGLPGFLLVVRAGLEPATHGFSVRCSTN